MLIRLGYDIMFEMPGEAPMVALLNVHPSRAKDLLEPDVLRVEPEVPIDTYSDSFGNICSRFVAPWGRIRLFNSTLIQDSGLADPQSPGAPQVPVGHLPRKPFRFFQASRYCEVDLLSNTAHELFGTTPPGWERVQTICG